MYPAVRATQTICFGMAGSRQLSQFPCLFVFRLAEPFSSFSSSSSSGLTGSGMLNSGAVTPAQVSDATSGGRLKLVELGRWEQGSRFLPSPYRMAHEGQTAPSSLSTTIFSPAGDVPLQGSGGHAPATTVGDEGSGSARALGRTEETRSGPSEEMQPGMTLPPPRARVPGSSSTAYRTTAAERAPAREHTEGRTENATSRLSDHDAFDQSRPESRTHNETVDETSKCASSHLERPYRTSGLDDTSECLGAQIQDEGAACGRAGEERITPGQMSSSSSQPTVPSFPALQFSSSVGEGSSEELLEGGRGVSGQSALVVGRLSPYYRGGTPTSSPGRHPPHPLACTADFGVAATTDTENTPPASCRSVSPSGYSSSPSSLYHRTGSFGLPSSSLPRGALTEGDGHSSAGDGRKGCSSTTVHRGSLATGSLHRSFLDAFTAPRGAEDMYTENAEEEARHLTYSFPRSADSPAVLGGLRLQRGEGSGAVGEAAGHHTLQASKEEEELLRQRRGSKGESYRTSVSKETSSQKLFPRFAGLFQCEKTPLRPSSGEEARAVSSARSSEPLDAPVGRSAESPRISAVGRFQAASNVEGSSCTAEGTRSEGRLFAQASSDFPAPSYLPGSDEAQRHEEESFPSMQQQVLQHQHFLARRQDVGFTVPGQAGRDERFVAPERAAFWTRGRPAVETADACSGGHEASSQGWPRHGRAGEAAASSVPLDTGRRHGCAVPEEGKALWKNQQVQASVAYPSQGVSAQGRSDLRESSLLEEEPSPAWAKGTSRGVTPVSLLQAQQEEPTTVGHGLWEQGAAKSRDEWNLESDTGRLPYQPIEVTAPVPSPRAEEEECSQGASRRGGATGDYDMTAPPHIPLERRLGNPADTHPAAGAIAESPRDLPCSEVRHHPEAVPGGEAGVTLEHQQTQAEDVTVPTKQPSAPRNLVPLSGPCGKVGIEEDFSRSSNSLQTHADSPAETLLRMGKLAGDSDREGIFDETTEAAVEVMVQFMNQELQAAGFQRIDTGGPAPRRRLGSRRVSMEDVANGVLTRAVQDGADRFSYGASRRGPDDDATTEAFIEADVYVYRILEGMADKLHEVLAAYKSRGERLGMLRRQVSSVASLEARCSAIREEKEEAEKQVSCRTTRVAQAQKCWRACSSSAVCHRPFGCTLQLMNRRLRRAAVLPVAHCR